jgi:hypothetical protein
MEAALGDGTQILIVGLAAADIRRSGSGLQTDLDVGNFNQSHPRLRRARGLKLYPGKAAATGLAVGTVHRLNEFGRYIPRDVDLAMPAFLLSFAFNLSSDNGKAN